MVANAQTKLYLTVGPRTLSATLDDNEATRSLIRLLGNGSVTISMSDYGGFEKVGSLPQSLPASDNRITTVMGDIMLYQGDKMVIFYGSNTWSYTPLGKIDGVSASSLREFLGNGGVNVSLSLSDASGIGEVKSDIRNEVSIHDLQGNRLKNVTNPGVYIVDGRKVFIK